MQEICQYKEIGDFEFYVPCLINVRENPFELTDQVTLYMEMVLTTEYPEDELGPSIPNFEAPLPLGHLTTHHTPNVSFSSFCDLIHLKFGFQNLFFFFIKTTSVFFKFHP